MMFLGAPRTFSYFQSGLDMRGRLAWGDHAEDVTGTVGWIDRQWAPDDFTRVPGHAREPVPQRMARHPARRRLGHELLPPVPARCAQRGRAVDRAVGTGAGACTSSSAPRPTSTSRFRSSSAARASSGAARCSPRGRAGSLTATGCARPNGTSTCAAIPWSTRRRTPCRSSTGPARCASRGGWESGPSRDGDSTSAPGRGVAGMSWLGRSGSRSSMP